MPLLFDIIQNHIDSCLLVHTDIYYSKETRMPLK